MSLETFGIKVKHVRIETYGLASRFRAASCSSADRILGELEEGLDSDDVIAHNTDPWIKESMCHHLGGALDHVHGIAPELEVVGLHVQSRCIAALLQVCPASAAVPQRLVHRLRNTIKIEESIMNEHLQLVKAAAKHLPNYLMLPYIRCMCNAWCTFKRM